MKKHLVLAAFGLSLAACAQAADTDGSTSADAVTANSPGPHIEPGPVQAVTSDAAIAAQVLFAQESLLLSADGVPSESAIKQWFDTTTAVDASFEERDETSSTFYFAGQAGSGVRYLVIEKDFPLTAFFPSYTARIDDAPAPATAKHFEGADLAAILALAKLGSIAAHTPADPAAIEFVRFAQRAHVVTEIDVQFLAPGDAKYTFGAVILGPAETTAGDASLALRVTGDTYVAKATINATSDNASANR